MTRTLSALALLLLAFDAAAARFLVSDPYLPGNLPDQFIVSIDGAEGVVSPAVTNRDGSKALKFDISNIAEGVHTVTVKAVRLPTANDAGEESIAASVTVKKHCTGIKRRRCTITVP